LRAGAADRGEHVLPVIRPKCAYFDRASVAETLDGRIVGGLLHDRETSRRNKEDGSSGTIMEEEQRSTAKA
jgi:hypothetical protein